MMSKVCRVQSPARLEGKLEVPGDKSISHRAILLNGIASGSARVTGVGLGADCRTSIATIKALGAKVRECDPDSKISQSMRSRESPGDNNKRNRGADLCVEGTGSKELHEPQDVLNAGNSGTTARLLAGLLAGQSFFSVLTGDRSLRTRPMGRVIGPLTEMGARITARDDNRLLPMAISPADLHGIEYRLPIASAQLKSCLLLAGLQATGTMVIHEPQPSRDHTERMLLAQGALLNIDAQHLTLHEGTSLSAIDIAVPGDLSSAAYWIVAALIHPQARITIRNVGVNPGRTGLIDVLCEMGGRISLSNFRHAGGEPVANITAESSRLNGIHVGGELIPRLVDEVPVLALAATLSEGKTTIRGAAELRLKESDRLATVARELTHIGGKVEELPDGLTIHGTKSLVGGETSTHGDHRLAMMACVAGLVSDGPVYIEGPDIVDVSYPGFWDDMHCLAPGAIGAI